MYDTRDGTAGGAPVGAMLRIWFPGGLSGDEAERVDGAAGTESSPDAGVGVLAASAEALAGDAPSDVLLEGLVEVLRAVGEPGRAARLLGRLRRHGDPARVPTVLRLLALVEAERGRMARARRLMALAGARARALGDDALRRRCQVEAARLAREAGFVHEARELLAGLDGDAAGEPFEPVLEVERLAEKAALGRFGATVGDDDGALRRLVDLGRSAGGWLEARARAAAARRHAERGAVERAVAVLRHLDVASLPPTDPSALLDVRLAEAAVHRAAGRVAAAEESLALAEAVAVAAGDGRRQAQVLMALGETLYRSGELVRARDTFRRVLVLERRAGRRLGVAEVLFRLGLVLRATGRLRQAGRLLERARNLFLGSGVAEGASRCALSLAAVAHARGLDQEARSLVQECVEDRRDRGDGAGTAQALGVLATLHRDRGEHDRALELYSESLDLRRESGDRYGLAVVLNDLAMVHRFRGEYGRALGLYQESLEIKRALGDRWGEALGLNDLALTHKDQGNFNEAFEAVEQGLRLARQLDAGVLAVRLGVNHAHLLASHGDGEAASRELTDTLRRIRRLGCLAEEPKALGALAEILRNRGRLAPAGRLLDRCQRLAEGRGDRRQLAWALLQRAHVEADRDALFPALELLGRCRALREELGEIRGLAEVLWREGLLHLRSGNAAAADERFRAADDLGSTFAFAGVRLLAGLGLVELKAGRAEAEEVIDEVEELLGRADDQENPEALFWAFRLMGELMGAVGDPAGALRYFGRALDTLGGGVWGGGRRAATARILGGCTAALAAMDTELASLSTVGPVELPTGTRAVLSLVFRGVPPEPVEKRVAALVELDSAAVPLVLSQGGRLVSQLSHVLVAVFPDAATARRVAELVRRRVADLGAGEGVSVGVLEHCGVPGGAGASLAVVAAACAAAEGLSTGPAGA